MECCADVVVDFQFGGEYLYKVGCEVQVSVRDHLCRYPKPGEYVLEI